MFGSPLTVRVPAMLVFVYVVLTNLIDFNTFVQCKASALLPLLRILHIHLHPHDVLNAPDDPRALISALGAFLRALNGPSPGTLVRLALTDHGALGDGAGADAWLPLFRDILGDARRFPSLRVVSLQGEGAGMGALHAAAWALPYELRAGPGAWASGTRCAAWLIDLSWVLSAGVNSECRMVPSAAKWRREG